MGSLYKRRHKTADGTIRESSIWWLKYHNNGVPHRESSGSTRESDAKRLLRLREGDVERGVAITPKVGRVRFSELCEDVEVDYQINKRRSLTDLKRRLRLHVLPWFGQRRASSITSANISKFIVQRQNASASNGEINRELTALKRAFNLGIRSGKILNRPYVAMLKEAPPRSGFFERSDFERVRSHLPQALQGLVTVAYISGWRTRSELLPMRWDQVDFAAGCIHLRAGETKNDDSRTFYFTDELREVFQAQRDYTNRLQREQGVVIAQVFHRAGKPIAGFRKAWNRACYKAGLPCRVETETGPDGKLRIKSIKAKAILHDFRRTAVRNLVRAGIPESVAQRLSGHKTRAIFSRYDIVSPSDLKNAATMLNTFHNAMGTKQGTTGESGNMASTQVIDSKVRARSSAG